MTRSDDITTNEDVHSTDVFGWPLMIAMLERIHGDATYALRYGMLQLARCCLNEMVSPKASAERVALLQSYIDVLAHLPWSREGEHHEASDR